MKQLAMSLRGFAFIALISIAGTSNADSPFRLFLDINALDTYEFDQPAISTPLFEQLRLDSDFLFSRNIDDRYTVGLNYTDVIIGNDDQYNRSNSNLLLMLQFKFN